MAANKVTLTFAGDTTSLDHATAQANKDITSTGAALTAHAARAKTASEGMGSLGDKFKESSRQIRGSREVIDGTAQALTAFGGAIPGPVEEIASMSLGLAHLARGIGEAVVPVVSTLATRFGLMTAAIEETTIAEDGSIIATGEMGAAQLTAAGTALKFAGAVGVIGLGLYLLKDKLEAAGTALGNWLVPLEKGTIDTTAADKANLDLADAFTKAGIGAEYAGAAQEAIYAANNKTGGSIEDLVGRLEKLGLTNDEVIATLENMGITADDADAAVNRMDFSGAEAKLAHLQAAAELAANGIYLAAEAAAAFSQFPTAANANAHKGIPSATSNGMDPALQNVNFATLALPKLGGGGGGGGAAAKVIKLTGKKLIDAFIEGIQGNQPQLNAALGSVSDGVKAKLQAMDSLVVKAKQVAQSIAAAFAPKVSGTDVSVINQLDYQLKRTQALQRDLAALAKSGLDKSVLENLMSGGVDSLDAADQLVNGGMSAIQRANADAKGINQAGNQIGNLGALSQTGVTLNSTNTVVLKLDGQTLAKVVVSSLKKAIKADGGNVQKVLGSGY